MVHIIDWFPTLANLIGYKNNIAFDGVDLAPVLKKTGGLPDRDLYWIWKPKTDRWALRYQDWKIVRYSTKEPKSGADWELYNLATDPVEKENIAAKYPEKVKELHARFLIQRAKDRKKGDPIIPKG